MYHETNPLRRPDGPPRIERRRCGRGFCRMDATARTPDERWALDALPQPRGLRYHFVGTVVRAPMTGEAPDPFKRSVRVFVAGGTGAIGRFLLPHLVEEGHAVIALVRTQQQ